MDRSSTASGDGAPSFDAGDGGRATSAVPEPAVPSRPAIGGEGDAAEGAGTPIGSDAEAVAADEEHGGGGRPEADAWAPDRVLAAAVGNAERPPSFNDLLRHSGALTRELGKAEQTIGRLTVERDALRRRLGERQRRAADPDPAHPADGEVVAAEPDAVARVEAGKALAVDPLQRTEADDGPPAVDPVPEAAAAASAQDDERRRWLLAVLLLGAVALLVIGWWALDPSFGMPWGGGGTAPTPVGTGG